MGGIGDRGFQSCTPTTGLWVWGWRGGPARAREGRAWNGGVRVGLGRAGGAGARVGGALVLLRHSLIGLEFLHERSPGLAEFSNRVDPGFCCWFCCCVPSSPRSIL